MLLILLLLTANSYAQQDIKIESIAPNEYQDRYGLAGDGTRGGGNQELNRMKDDLSVFRAKEKIIQKIESFDWMSLSDQVAPNEIKDFLMRDPIQSLRKIKFNYLEKCKKGKERVVVISNNLKFICIPLSISANEFDALLNSISNNLLGTPVLIESLRKIPDEELQLQRHLQFEEQAKALWNLSFSNELNEKPKRCSSIEYKTRFYQNYTLDEKQRLSSRIHPNGKYIISSEGTYAICTP